MSYWFKAGALIAAVTSVALCFVLTGSFLPNFQSYVSRFMTKPKTSTAVDMETQQLRLLVIGKTGNGKSTVGNVLLGRNVFPVGRSMASTTLKANDAAVLWNNDQLKVVDTPDPVNCGEPGDVASEVNRWKAMTSPYPSAILLAIRCDVRYTQEEYDVYRQIKSAWGTGFNRRLVVVFTFGDRQDKPIDQELQSVNSELKSVLRDAKHRYVVFDGQPYNRDGQLAQIQEFVRQMDREPVHPDWYRPMQILLGVLAIVLFIMYKTSTVETEPQRTSSEDKQPMDSAQNTFYCLLAVLFALLLVLSEALKEHFLNFISSL